ncbi:MAG: DNA methyltransferase, partial [Bacteroidota bacterium]
MRYVDTSWDFRKANTKQVTHCFHTYPAMMIPQIAEKLLSKYGNNSKRLFDPYCGTGTSLVEANIKDINAIGTD